MWYYLIICFLWALLAVYNDKKFFGNSNKKLFITFIFNFIFTPITIGIFIYKFKKGTIDIVFPLTKKSRNIQPNNSCSYTCKCGD
jgi:hypothetical protein